MMENYIEKQYPNIKVFILSDQQKGRPGGINTVVSSLIPLLENRIDIYWKTCPRIGRLKIFPIYVKLILASFITFLKFLFDKKVKECQIINGHGKGVWLSTIWLSKVLKKISVITFHETYEYTRLKWFFGGGKLAQWVWNYTIKNADYIIDLSNTLKLKKTFYIPNGVNIELFKPAKLGTIKKDKKVVLFVGRLDPEKGLEYFIRASEIIKQKLKGEVEFLIVTSTLLEAKEKLKMVNKLKEKGIEFLENIPYENMPKIYQKADVLVLPSLCEAFPLVNLEAMSCGIPVVATNVGGTPIAVKDGLVGFLIPPKDPQAIAEKVIKILENEKLREEMKKNCLEWVKNFTWEKVAQRYLEIYQKISQEKI